MNKIQSLKNAQEFQDLFGIQEHAKLSFPLKDILPCLFLYSSCMSSYLI